MLEKLKGGALCNWGVEPDDVETFSADKTSDWGYHDKMRHLDLGYEIDGLERVSSPLEVKKWKGRRWNFGKI